MNIEEEIFKKSKINYSNLINYGFIKNQDIYTYQTNILNDTMKCLITIKDNVVSGIIIDLATNSEYTNFRLNNISGEFSSSIKESYQNILNDIKAKCTIQEAFIMPQSNRLTKIIKENYDIEPDFLWQSYPGYGVFRNQENNKWFAVIMDIDKSKLNKKTKGIIEAINVKLATETNDFLSIEGIYPAYHMNKKYWVTIILDDTLKDEYIVNLIAKSYNNVAKSK